ncbi:hypothetical protein ACFFX0_20140 [Citricoccus parietis]|uniref:Uncharacterized protein n=1 Tax=Citricoccus parietis TaxID=592307 RepID=A0ABV5G373_9MICC
MRVHNSGSNPAPDSMVWRTADSGKWVSQKSRTMCRRAVCSSVKTAVMSSFFLASTRSGDRCALKSTVVSITILGSRRLRMVRFFAG